MQAAASGRARKVGCFAWLACPPVQGRAAHLLFSGSHPGGSVAKLSEANVMRGYAEQLLGHEGPQDGRYSCRQLYLPMGQGAVRPHAC